MVQGQRVEALEPALQWRLDWSTDARDASSAADVTLGTLLIAFGNELIWGPEDGDWPWSDLLQWLSKSWVWLRGEDGLPKSIDGSLSLMQNFEVKIHDRDAMEDTQGGRMALWNFRETHDLSRALYGASAPALMIWREGLRAHLLTDRHHHISSWTGTLAALEGLGDSIAERIGSGALLDAAAHELVRGWELRDERDPMRLLALARSQGESATVSAISPRWSDVDLEPLETSPLLAAARMSGGLSAEVAETILGGIARLPRRDTDIDLMSEAVLSSASVGMSEPAYEQGYRYANEFRRQVKWDSAAPFSPERWLLSMNILVRDITLTDNSVEAVAAWGPRNGPAVLINRLGKASRWPGGRNASLAHEIGHLIIDRFSALPAAEVLAGRVSNQVERRARAFAAEVLLPRAVAGTAMSSAGTRDEARQTLHNLMLLYGVSRELAAWQVQNSALLPPSQVLTYIEEMTNRDARRLRGPG